MAKASVTKTDQLAGVTIGAVSKVSPEWACVCKNRFLEREVMAGWQCMKPSLQTGTYTYSNEFSGAKTTDTDLQIRGKKRYGKILHLIPDEWGRACVAYTEGTVQAWMLDPCSEAIRWLCYAIGAILADWIRVSADYTELVWVISFIIRRTINRHPTVLYVYALTSVIMKKPN